MKQKIQDNLLVLERDCVEKADDMAVLSDRMIRLGLTSSLQTP